MATFNQKLGISLFSGLIFGGVNHPATYALTSDLVSSAFTDLGGCPTSKGLLMHTLVFLVIVMLTMGNPLELNYLKFKYSLYGALVFFFLSSPAMYSLTGELTGGLTADANGCPTLNGVVVHSLVYALALLGLMYLPPDLAITVSRS
jgi:hypothetical protein